MNDQIMAGVAKALIQYHRNSLRIRTFSHYVMPEMDRPVCGEMDNLSKRLTSDYSAIEMLLQMDGLNSIIKIGSEELDKIYESAVETEEASIFLEKAQEVYGEVSAARKLLEMLDGQ